MPKSISTLTDANSTEESADLETPGPGPRFSLTRALPLLILVTGLVAFVVFDLGRFLSFEALRDNREFLTNWVQANGVWAILSYIGIYIVVVAFSLPGAAIMSLTGGFLFGWMAGGLYIVIAATIGATLVFLAAKTALGDYLRAKAGGAIKKMESGFQKNAFSYMLFLRLIPAFPFFLVNLVPAFLGVRLPTYVTATFLGIIPGSFVYASVGNGLGAIFDRGETPNLGIIFEPQILLPIVGLAVLALLPVLYNTFFKKPDRSAP